MQFPQFDLAGQVSLVTGAARGLGRSISLALAHAGSDVALGLRDIHSPGTLVSEIETLGRRALPLQMDVTNLDQIFRAVQQTVSHFGSARLSQGLSARRSFRPALPRSATYFCKSMDDGGRGIVFSTRHSWS